MCGSPILVCKLAYECHFRSTIRLQGHGSPSVDGGNSQSADVAAPHPDDLGSDSWLQPGRQQGGAAAGRWADAVPLHQVRGSSTLFGP